MSVPYYVTLLIHVLATIVWVGGVLFFWLVGLPAARRFESDEVRIQLLRYFGFEFRWVSWVAVGLLVASGFVLMQMKGLLQPALLTSPAFWGSSYGTTLAWKLGTTGAVVVLKAFHDYYVAPLAGRVRQEDTPRAARIYRAAIWLARFNAFLAVVIVAIGVRLARG